MTNREEVLEQNWDIIVSMMDDELREIVHNRVAPCSLSDFIDEYISVSNDYFDEMILQEFSNFTALSILGLS